MGRLVVSGIVGFALSGCVASGWIKSDGGNLTNEELRRALEECDFEEKRKLANIYLASSHSGTEEKRQRAKQLHENTYNEAVNCMKIKGIEKS